MFHRYAMIRCSFCLRSTKNGNHFVHSTLAILLLINLAAGTVVAEDWSPLWSTATLSQPRASLGAASAGGKVLFAGGEQIGVMSNVVDIYDVATGAWSTSQLSIARSVPAATSTSGKIFFGGGWAGSSNGSDRVDIFDTGDGSWSTASLSQGRYYLAAASNGTRVFFAGGENSTYSNLVDVFDSANNNWSQMSLSRPRCLLEGVSAGNKTVFAGGFGNSGYSNAVDIFDAGHDNWSTATLSHARGHFAATSTEGQVFFGGGCGAGGGNCSNVVDVYDATNNSWSTKQLSQARYDLAAGSVGSKVFFAGGYTGSSLSNVVDIYDTSTYSWSTATLSQSRSSLSAVSAGNKLFFAGGSANTSRSDRVDIYTLQTYGTITSSKAFALVDQTTVTGRMQLNADASLNLNGYNLTVGSMAGVAPINLSTHTFITGSDNTDSVYSGPLSGNGNLIKTGDGVLTLSGNNSYLGLVTVNAGELVLVGPNAWNPIMNLGGAYISGGDIVFDYKGDADPYATVLSLLNVKINGSMPISVTDDTVNDRITVSFTVPEPSVLVLAVASLLTLLAYAWRQANRGV